jgi:hypothetical protein
MATIRRLTKAFGTDRFPPPPVPGSAAIQPITTIEDLLAEGETMHNCVGSYAVKVMRGDSYIYRVLAPQRATLEIIPLDGMYLPNQLKTACNGEPAQETREAVEVWLAEENRKGTGIRGFHSP